MNKFIDCVLYTCCVAIASASVMLTVAAAMMALGYIE